jgi:hypothetical protein
MCFAKTSDFLSTLPGTERLPELAFRILCRLYDYDVQAGRQPTATYGGGCYLIAHALSEFMGDGYEMEVVGLKKKGGILTPHVVCIGPFGSIVDAKYRWVTSRPITSKKFTPQFAPGGFMCTQAAAPGSVPRSRAWYVRGVSARDFTDGQTSVELDDGLTRFGDTYRATFNSLQERVKMAKKGNIPEGTRKILEFILA